MVTSRLTMAEAQRSAPEARLRSDLPSLPPHESLVAALEAAAKTEIPFLTLHVGRQQHALSYKHALEGAWRVSAALRKRGVKKGDRVALLLPTSLLFVESLLGSMLAGAVPVPLASPMTFGGVERYLKNLTVILKDAGAQWMITYPRIQEAAAADDELKAILRHVLTEADFDGSAPVDPRSASISGADLAFLQYTSGTTGRPKGVMVSHRAAVSNTYSISCGLEQRPGDVGVSWLPLFHDMGLIGALLLSICHPFPLHVMPPERFIVRPGGWLKLMGEVGATLSPAPNFAYDLCTSRGGDIEGVDLSKWRVALNGSEPVHLPTIERFTSHFASNGFKPESLMPVYGMAEATLAVTFSAAHQRATSLAVERKTLEIEGRVVRSELPGARMAVSVGRPLAGMSVSITSDSGRVLEDGEVGEIRVAGPSLMDGYFQNEVASAAALCDGWLRTGDLGFVWGGQLYITGRAKEMVIKSGRNLYPYDIERIVGELPGVRLGGVAAFGRTNETTGTDDLIVVAETSQKESSEHEALTKAIRGEVLAVLGVGIDVVRLWPVGSVPRTSSGKIRRKECARLLEEEA